ncbi:Uncharacterized protein HZ326_20270 [Fusarium oxysporum f. sp. albedinis]|nr:Uncharacterized protein HZ326_20270 [Fusarium oxysporum f. sp. albedinis]
MIGLRYLPLHAVLHTKAMDDVHCSYERFDRLASQLLNYLTRNRAVPKPIARIGSKTLYCLYCTGAKDPVLSTSMATSPIKKDGDTCIKTSRRAARKGANTETRTCG